ncbi:hypothetical protein EXIGLDRAFT_116914 [Exidia glandulosa HHB12029]|uniref:Uncharacterized protein n=1 Tax=Exidia glandulosa HHB12029 TaxID=1314781 RepID=A0A165GJN2_EXIGL|nr:hypothetical protein EXIGLDRAFT_116914 [Exidia glandulosa HHB12029]
MRTKREGADSDPDEDMAELRRTVARAPTEGGGRGRRVRRAGSLSSKQGPASQSAVGSPVVTSQAPSPPEPLSTSPELHAPRPVNLDPYADDPSVNARAESAFDYSRAQTATHMQQMVPDDRYYHPPSGHPPTPSAANERSYPVASNATSGNPLLLGDYALRSAPPGGTLLPPRTRTSPHITS